MLFLHNLRREARQLVSVRSARLAITLGMIVVADLVSSVIKRNVTANVSAAPDVVRNHVSAVAFVPVH